MCVCVRVEQGMGVRHKGKLERAYMCTCIRVYMSMCNLDTLKERGGIRRAWVGEFSVCVCVCVRDSVCVVHVRYTSTHTHTNTTVRPHTQISTHAHIIYNDMYYKHGERERERRSVCASVCARVRV